jgi:hypothetical protein
MSKFIVQRRSLLLGGAALALAPAAAFAAPTSASRARLQRRRQQRQDWSLAELKGKVVVLETTNQDCPYVRKHYNSTNMQTQQREAAAKGVVWLTVASSAPGEQGFVTAAQANELTEAASRAGRLPARSAKQDRARLRRDRDAAHVHHRCLGRAGLQGRHRFDPVARASRRPEGQAVCARGARRGAGRQAGQRGLDPPYGCTLKYGNNAA